MQGTGFVLAEGIDPAIAGALGTVLGLLLGGIIVGLYLKGKARQKRLSAERAADRKLQVGSGDRSERIRTYNFPQNRCSDHRLGENFALEQVMAGKLMPVLQALDEQDREARIQEL